MVNTGPSLGARTPHTKARGSSRVEADGIGRQVNLVGDGASHGEAAIIGLARGSGAFERG